MVNHKLMRILALWGATLLVTSPVISLAELDVQVRGGKERVTAKRITALVARIDATSREITLQGPLGNLITIVAGPEVRRFEEFEVGDLVSASYVSSMVGDLRPPTEAELAEPMVVLETNAGATQSADPGAAAGLTIRAVCTIESMNRATRTVTLKDPEGEFHILDDVDPTKMEGVSAGDTVIVTYTQTFALTLEKQASTE